MEEVYIKLEQTEIEIKCENVTEIKTELFKSESNINKISSSFNEKVNQDTDISIKRENTHEDTNLIPEFSISSYSDEITEQIEVKGEVYEDGKKNQLSCSQCEKTFKNQANFKNHLKFMHSDNHRVQCSQCFRIFKSHGDLCSHLDSVHAVTEEVSCDICSKVFLNHKKLKNHIYYTHPQPGEQVNCTESSKTYKSQYNLKMRHNMLQVHPKGQSVPCPYCDKMFKVDMLLERHLKCSHPDDGMVYKCQQCFKVLPSLACYKKHIENTHDASLRATCDLCERIFKTKKSLERHLKNIHDGREIKAYVPSKFVCSYCERGFESNTSLCYHTQTYHMGDSASDTDILNTHCEICDKSYSDNAALQCHIASVHPIEIVTCNICMKEFKSAINLQNHIRFTHGWGHSSD